MYWFSLFDQIHITIYNYTSSLDQSNECFPVRGLGPPSIVLWLWRPLASAEAEVAGVPIQPYSQQQQHMVTSHPSPKQGPNISSRVTKSSMKSTTLRPTTKLRPKNLPTVGKVAGSTRKFFTRTTTTAMLSSSPTARLMTTTTSAATTQRTTTTMLTTTATTTTLPPPVPSSHVFLILGLLILIVLLVIGFGV